MKITKTKEVITEDIDVQPGTYYFECGSHIARKFTLFEKEDDSLQEFVFETLYGFSNRTGINMLEDNAWDENDLPYDFKQFILGIAGKKIEKEQYYKERTEILNKLKL